jgi:probable phosphoglycerate mutase
MKKIYLIRHGESEANVNNGPIYDSVLTQEGLRQAEFIAERCSKLPADLIIASPLKRTLQTAEKVRLSTGKPLEVSDLFVERKPPKEAEQMNEKEWESIRVIVDENLKKPGARYADEEDFSQMLVRADQALKHLIAKDAEAIIVVTHGIFIRVLVGRAIFGENFDGEIFFDMLNGMRVKNTGLTVLEQREDSQGWRLVTWNDHAHLG